MPSSLDPPRSLETSSWNRGPPIARRRVDDATRHWIRSHSRTLETSRVIMTAFAFNACGVRLGAGSRCPSACFRPGGADSSEPRAPSHAERGASLRSRWPARGCERHALHSLARASRASVGSGCESRMRVVRTRRCAPGGEPRLVVSRTPHRHPPGPQCVGTTRYVLTVGRRATRSARGAALRRAASSVTRPAKDEILVQLEVPSIRPTGSHAWDASDDVRCEVALVAVVTRWLPMTLRLVDDLARGPCEPRRP